MRTASCRRADEIAAELEKFLAYRRTRDDDTPLGG